MSTLLIFGAGNIGRGFIAPLFAAAGWQITIVEVEPTRLGALQRCGSYTVDEVDGEHRRQVTVSGVVAIDGRDQAAVAAALAAADLVATAVGLAALPVIGAAIGAGLAVRWQQSISALDVLVCENGVQARHLLRTAIVAALPAAMAASVDTHCGLVRCSIGRMIPPGGKDGDPLAISVEPYATLPVDGAAFRGPPPTAVKGLELVVPFDLAEQQKLYLHNGTHAALAYAGQRRGHSTLVACMADRDLVAAVRAAGLEIVAALALAHGGGNPEQEGAIRRDARDQLDGLLRRYANPALGDTVARVARDPWRKLAADDRLIGGLRLCRSLGLPCNQLARLVFEALHYRADADEPRAAAWNDAPDWRSRVEQAAGLSADDDLVQVLAISARQAAAAARIRAAGLVLTMAEEADLEIADFGLGDFDQVGLAVHVYVNTARCCAKELALEPGQMCPEHRHPSIDGRPGKEETFRVRSGECHLFLPGAGDAAAARAYLPPAAGDAVTVFRHLHLRAGDQATLVPDTLHWFVAGPAGAVVSEFSTSSNDDADIFTDERIQRAPAIGPHVG